MSDGRQTVVRCPHCQTKNRIPLAKLEHQVRCGKCQEMFDLTTITSGAVRDLDETQFGQVVTSALVPTLVDFWAPWCQPCLAMAPVLEQLALEWRGRVNIVKINTDENQHLPGQFKVQGIPTLVLIEGTKTLDTMVGAIPKTELKARVERFLS